MRYFFMSDAHLGSLIINDNVAHQAIVMRWLEARATDITEAGGGAIYLLGDIFDFWFEFAHSIPPGYEKILNCIKKITDSGVEVHFFCGNHDQWTFGYLANHCGMIVHRSGDKISLGDKTFYMAHGHGLGEKTFFTKLMNSIFESSICRWLFRHLMPPRLGLWIGYKWSGSNKEKEEGKYKNRHIDYYTAHSTDEESQQSKWSKTFSAANPDVNYIIMGHLHKEVNMMLPNGCQLVILDEFYTKFGYGEFDGNGVLLETYRTY